MPKVLVTCLSDCVHVAGVARFLEIARQEGYETHFTGPATDLEDFLDEVTAIQPDIIGVSYRLAPDNARILFAELRDMLQTAQVLGKARIFFGGTPPVAAVAREFEFFDCIFSGDEPGHAVRVALRGDTSSTEQPQNFPQGTVERMKWKAPHPLLRHHFGVPAQNITPTVEGIATIAEAAVLDVISLGPDQDAQEHFFHPLEQNPKSKGAGGVPFRSEADLHALYEARRCGNFPLLRSYSGTADHIRYADMLLRTIHNAWCATSLFWFNAMDGRGSSPLEQSIRDHQALMHWHGKRNIPVEGNEPHHWAMRDAPDAVVCASAYIYAYNAKHFGVRDYIMTYMFQSPPQLSNTMDLARCLAQIELSERFADEGFRVWRQTRTGLLSYPVNAYRARAHLAQSTMLQMAVKPHIVHVVGYCEADHAATTADVVESTVMAQEVIETALRGTPDMTRDTDVQQRKTELLAETMQIIDAIRALDTDSSDPLLDPVVLVRAVACGLLNAPQLNLNPYASPAHWRKNVC